ncbi:cobalamin biosynthesis protein CbiD [Vallitalea pronyensis]|uniref:Cobalt-precorrin-5B C(1)-methyltransferase n=1 Tax=Vallitalea pronyensis TaxID=1348613 RepID=A0A8J8SFN6_9FIRM|nr:cobalt-precorrin-5B (C(1))-methyltransferase CbiD [Vallitalea pronyensis]QUI21791.1 cobalamin biosynthesis protein CbiD [Vallitalea pronyensis]
MERFIEKEGKKLRYGYTTGSCATAAAKAAAMMLMHDIKPQSVLIGTPKGWDLNIPVYPVEEGADYATCYVIKDAGDDPDVTHGMRIYATVKKTDQEGIRIQGGVGIGTVTKKGLRISVGQSAINPTPLMTIDKEVRQVLPAGQGVDITIFAPEGEAIAKKTFNANLGIIGGISIIGTSGIVEPMSEDALMDTLKVELGIKKANHGNWLVYVFGNFGRDYAMAHKIEEKYIQKISNFVAFMMEEAYRQGFRKILFIGHVGKMVKVAAGSQNTHSKYGDGRMASIAACAAACHVNETVIQKIHGCNTTDEAVGLLKAHGKAEEVFEHMAEKCQQVCQGMCHNKVQVACIIFSTIHGTLGRSADAEDMLTYFT